MQPKEVMAGKEKTKSKKRKRQEVALSIRVRQVCDEPSVVLPSLTQRAALSSSILPLYPNSLTTVPPRPPLLPSPPQE